MLALRLDYRRLWLHLILALAYAVPSVLLDTITPSPVLDGAIGVLLGLAICSVPARNTIDTLFANRFALGQLLKRPSGRGWLALNGLVTLAGWTVILLGMVSLAGA